MDSIKAQQRWQRVIRQYVDDVNGYVAKGLAEGWDEVGDEPKFDDDCSDLLPVLLDALRVANRGFPRQDIKDQWPPSHIHLLPLLEENAQSIPTLLVLPDSSILARIGAAYVEGRVVRIHGDEVIEVEGVQHFGRCPGRRFFAIARDDGIEVTDGWQGPRVALCRWPLGTEGVPEEFTVVPFNQRPNPTRLVPFPDGKRVLLVASCGVFVLAENGAQRLLPTREQIHEHFTWLKEERPNETPSASIDMEHGTVSPNGALIAVGGQDGRHLVFDAKLRCIAQIGPHGEYPHFAAFSSDGHILALNACHFYNGATIGVTVDKLAGIDSDFYEDADGVKVIESGARVYAAAVRGDEFIFGDAYGYLRAVDGEGNLRWQHFLGSTIGDMDLSDDENTLVVSSYAGAISIINLDADRQQPYQIGNGGHFERRRWLFWKTEPAPLAW